MDGYVKVFRQMTDWEWYTDKNAKSLFLHCLLKVNFKDVVWRGINIAAGSFITSHSTLATELDMSPQEVRTAIKKLVSTGEITTMATNRYTTINVVNWPLYQTQDTDTNKPSNNQNNKRKKTAKKKEEPTPSIEESKTDLELAIERFLEYRKKIKSPMTEYAIQLMIKKLDKLASDDATKIAIIEQSILNGYKGVFPLKDDSNKKSKTFKPDIQVDWLDDYLNKIENNEIGKDIGTQHTEIVDLYVNNNEGKLPSSLEELNEWYIEYVKQN